MKEMVGTLYTMAPEVLLGNAYNRSCDMWSIGVIAFVLLSGDMPFDFSSKKRLIKSVEDGRYDFSGRRWNYISCEARRVGFSLARRTGHSRTTVCGRIGRSVLSKYMLPSPWWCVAHPGVVGMSFLVFFGDSVRDIDMCT